MNKIKIPDINLNEFDYDLPKDRIALYPAAKRDESRLLIANIDSQIISHGCFKDISNVIPENSLLVLNETKVIQARLLFRKPTGGKVEFLLVEPVEPSGVPVITLESKGKCRWDCIVGGKRVREGMLLETAQEGLNLQAKIIERDNNTGIIEFIWDSYKPFSEIIEVSGAMPLPPYIDRESEQIDKKRYQTVYANNNGSVAAPTAGLHFTDNVFADLRKKNIEITNITLHVGPGTFQPIAGNDISKHSMHYEHIYISKKTIESIIAAKKKGRNIIAVGTTCCRTVESLYWHALKLYNNVDTVNDINISQWEPYQHTELPSTVDMFTFLLNHLELNEKDEISGKTQLFIVPGYDFRVFNGLITNFHLPKSTLILLVAAFTGKSFWAKIYENALNNDFRFLSYGDSTILLKSIG
jgi:S-adenosylmethionine:tRNA ribosyltransferase-isomerase